MEFGDDDIVVYGHKENPNARQHTAVLGGIVVDTTASESVGTKTNNRLSSSSHRSQSGGRGRVAQRRESSKESASPLVERDQAVASRNMIVLTDDEDSPPLSKPHVREASADLVMSSPTTDTSPMRGGTGSPVYGSTQPFLGQHKGDDDSIPNPHGEAALTRAEHTLERALDGAATRLHQRMNVLYVAIIGFVLIGLCAAACITFGVVEIATNDKVFSNVGFGEVLTVLGIYFTVPYLFILIAFFVTTHNIGWVKTISGAVNDRLHIMFLSAIVALYVLQQCFTDVYLVLLNSEWYLFVVIGDVLVLASLFLCRGMPWGHMMHIGLFALKLGLQWKNAYQATTQPIFGPNGVSVMLFLCIPLVQMPLQSSFLFSSAANEEGKEKSKEVAGDDQTRRLLSPAPSPGGVGQDVYSDRGSVSQTNRLSHPSQNEYSPMRTPNQGSTPNNGSSNTFASKSGENSRARQAATSIVAGFRAVGRKPDRIVDTLSTFATNFNLYLSHLMHSLDIMALYFFSFESPNDPSSDLTPAPAPFRNFIAVISIFAFVVNNLVVLHLFFHRKGILDVVIPGLPRVITNLAEKGSGVTRLGTTLTSGANHQGFLSTDPRSQASAGQKGRPSDDGQKAAHRVKMLQYMIIMLIVVDIPFVIARVELWRKSYASLSIFVAKNIKDIVDMTMLLSRNEGDEEGGGDGTEAVPSSNRLPLDKKLRGVSVVIPQGR